METRVVSKEELLELLKDEDSRRALADWGLEDYVVRLLKEEEDED